MKLPPQSQLQDRRRLLSASEAALLLGVSEALLRKWRARHQGPRYRKMGRRVLYQLRDLDAYIASLPAGGTRRSQVA